MDLLQNKRGMGKSFIDGSIKMTKDWIRHGDVVLHKVEAVIGTKKKMSECILAEGEVTGHYHRLKGNICECVTPEKRFIEVTGTATLSHEEHDTLEIPEGKYEVLIQREVDLLGQVRQVMD